MADIQYLNYGDLQIELLALLNNLANQVQGYVLKQPWSNKRKEKFMSAYSDLMNRGIIGASNSTGKWVIDVNGEDIDFDSKDKKDKEMYQEAAYFIQLQMAALPTKAQEEEAKKEELPLFDNDYFTESFGKHVNNTISGGRPINIGYGEDDLWNYLDPRDEKTGKRGRTQRAAKLAELLEQYSSSLEEGKYNFEGSPFKDLNDFKGKLNKAVEALRTDSIDDDAPALNALGLKLSLWFNDGSGDPSGKTLNGLELTYGLLAEYNKALEEKKVEDLKLLNEKAKQSAYNNTLFINRVTSSKMSGRNPQELKEKYQNHEGLLSALTQYSQKDIRNLSPDEMSEVHGAYKYLAKDPIDNNLLKQLQSSSSGLYKGAAPNRFRKIKGIDNLIWDDAAKQVIQINTRTLQQALLNQSSGDLFSGVKTDKEKELDYLNSKIPGVTNAEWKELTSIGLDIASIIDPEPITAAGLGIGAAELRREAINETPGHKWNFWEKVGQGVDYATGGLAAIPILGDAGLGVKLALKSNKWIPIVTKAFRMVARAGAWKDLADSIPGIQAAYDKMTKGEELTVGDWRAIALGIRGIAGHGMLNKGNRATRKVLEESGYSTTPSNVRSNAVTRELAREGFFSSKVKGETSTPTLKVKKVDSDGKVVERKQIDLELSQLETLRKTKPSELDTKAKELLGEKIPEGYTVDVNTGWRAKGKNLIPYANKNTSAFSTKSVGTERGTDNFENWLNSRGIWSKMYYGWNPRMRTIRNGLNISSASGTTSGTTNTTDLNKPILALPNKNPLVPNSPLNRSDVDVNPLNIRKNIETPTNYKNVNLKDREIIESFQQSYGLGGLKSTPMREGFGGNAVKAGKYENELLSIALSKNRASELRSNPGKLAEWRGENARKLLSLIELKKASDKDIVEIIKGLKKKGFLRQGGTIDKQKIQQYKEYITK